MHNPKLPNIQTVLLPTVLLRTGPHGNSMWNWDIANASKECEKLSMVLAGWKDFASTCVLCPSQTSMSLISN